LYLSVTSFLLDFCHWKSSRDQNKESQSDRSRKRKKTKGERIKEKTKKNNESKKDSKGIEDLG